MGVGAAVALCLALTSTGALASVISVGSPQPELAPFSVAPLGGGVGSGTVSLADGTVVLVSLSKNGTTAAVCSLQLGDRQCTSTATLTAYSASGEQDSFIGVPQVIATGGSDVTVVLEDCCHIPLFSGVGGAVIFDSTNDGATFSKEIPAGIILGVDAATFADGQLVVASSETTSLNVQAFLKPPYVAISTPVNPNGRHDGDTSLTTYEGGVLVASDDASGNTLVEYAPKGRNFNLSSSYGPPVGIFNGEDLAGVCWLRLAHILGDGHPRCFPALFRRQVLRPAPRGARARGRGRALLEPRGRRRAGACVLP